MSNKKWSADNIPDMNGKTVVITGANTGIGKESARLLAKANATVILAVRSQEKGDAAAEDIRHSVPTAKLLVKHLDLAALDSVKKFAADIADNIDGLDILINNAGVMMCPHTMTNDGFEMQIGTNHLGHFALTLSLLPLLKKRKHARIVILSSLAHKQGKLDINDLNWQTRKYNPGFAYNDSKLANALFALELAERLKTQDNHPLVVAAHPGITQTDLARHSTIGAVITKLLAQTVHMGALPTLRAATEQAASPGDFFGPGGLLEMRGSPVEVKFSQRAHDKDKAKALWAASEKMTGLTLSNPA